MGWNISHFYDGDDVVTYIEIESIDSPFERLIDEYISQVCFGSTVSTICSVDEAKKHIKDFIAGDNEKRKMGAFSEFFLHLYLITEGYTQECAFSNLEENSPKKGFDGVYLDEKDEIWYMESKSGDEKNVIIMAKCKRHIWI